MLFLVISTPEPDRPREVESQRSAFRSWVGPLQEEGKVRSFHRRVGRGAVVLFDVGSNDELHELLTQWLNIVPGDHAVYPLLDR